MTELEAIGELSQILKDEGLIGQLGKTHRSIFCDALNRVAIERLMRHAHTSCPLILVASLLHLKQFIPNLPPRVETLLFYHRRPLILFCRDWVQLPRQLADSTGRIQLQIAFNPKWIKLMSYTEHPIALLPQVKMMTSQSIHESAIDFWIPPEGTYFSLPQEAEQQVKVEFNEAGELLFL